MGPFNLAYKKCLAMGQWHYRKEFYPLSYVPRLVRGIQGSIAIAGPRGQAGGRRKGGGLTNKKKNNPLIMGPFNLAYKKCLAMGQWHYRKEFYPLSYVPRLVRGIQGSIAIAGSRGQAAGPSEGEDLTHLTTL